MYLALNNTQTSTCTQKLPNVGMESVDVLSSRIKRFHWGKGGNNNSETQNQYKTEWRTS